VNLLSYKFTSEKLSLDIKISGTDLLNIVVWLKKDNKVWPKHNIGNYDFGHTLLLLNRALMS
jgi:hypothetical protein